MSVAIDSIDRSIYGYPRLFKYIEELSPMADSLQTTPVTIADSYPDRFLEAQLTRCSQDTWKSATIMFFTCQFGASLRLKFRIQRIEGRQAAVLTAYGCRLNKAPSRAP